MNRIVSIDIIRGFALFGIFLVNMPAFHSAEFMRMIYGVEREVDGADYWLDLFFALFIDMKFFTIFSFLFGLGFYIFMSRAEEKGLRVKTLYLRRILVLFLFGAAHLVLLWFGDILHTYAITGLLLLFFYKRKIKTILIWAFSLLFVYNALMSMPLLIPSDLYEAIQEEYQPYYEEHADEYVEMYKTASYTEWVSYRFNTEVVVILGNMIANIPPILALFLFGLAAGKAGIFKRTEEFISLLKRVQVWTMGIGAVLVTMLALFKTEILDMGVKTSSVTQLFTSLSGVVLCFFYVSTLTLLLQREKWQQRLRPLGNAGQMALTNYLMQTIISLTIFLGFDLYEKLSLLTGTLLCLVIFSVQLFVSSLWLKTFQYGPFEWIWRIMTYGKLLPIKKKSFAKES
ncbi:DUF418 domain-containing protein [Bacillus weihaiensis]|uniref:DUF418 domain-containing protein n=1 Tax=Bacillus weihaiensis TaxID=1547283 RepID=UPI0023544DCE|nr:DUF418 domain-containing protein [Bacillus weihaiensis]